MPLNFKTYYFDYASTTPVDPKVVSVMAPYFNKKFGNPNSLHHLGREANQVLMQSRETIAKIIQASPEEIIFTSSATESNNLALKGVAWANKNRGNHIIISSIEHDCVLNSARWLEGQGFSVTYLPVNREGLVFLNDLKKAIKPQTILVSIMHANNEIGTIEPIEAIGDLCRKKNIFFHTDAAQTFGKISIDVRKMNIDLLTASAHKIYGPKGSAFLYVRKGVKIEPLLHGGEQESALRSSTVNMPGVVGLATAAALSQKLMKKENAKMAKMRDQLIKAICKNIPSVSLNGHPTKRLSNNINLRFKAIEGESLLMLLDAAGVCVSTGSACSSAKLTASHVLLSCGLRPEEAHGSLRITLGRHTTNQEINYLLKALAKAVKKLRNLSPYF